MGENDIFTILSHLWTGYISLFVDVGLILMPFNNGRWFLHRGFEHILIDLFLRIDQSTGWSWGESRSLRRAGTLPRWWKVLLPYSGQGSSGGGSEEGVDSAQILKVDSMLYATRLVWGNEQEKSPGWLQGLGVSKVLVGEKSWLMHSSQ